MTSPMSHHRNSPLQKRAVRLCFRRLGCNHWCHFVALGVVAGFLITCLVLSQCAEISVSYMVQVANVHPIDPAAKSVLQISSGRPLVVPAECDCGVEKLPVCEVIHIAVVCGGADTTRQTVSTLVKSILFHRSRPVHLHLVVDPRSRQTLSLLFSTWIIPSLSISFYNASDVVSDVLWIPNRHYSGVYGLMKLVLPQLLPEDLNRVIVLDSDIILTADIVELWKTVFSGEECLALVENLSDWYLGRITAYPPWPALSRGFNTGVIVLDLARLRSINWNEMWREVTRKTLQTHHVTTLADQDVINAVIRKNPSMVKQLPCEWNLQLGDNARLDLCRPLLTDIRALHWNSPLKNYAYLEQSDVATFAQRRYRKFLGLDGYHLRDYVSGCPNQSTVIQGVPVQAPSHPSGMTDDAPDECYEFTQSRTFQYRRHTFFLSIDQPATDPNDVTLCTQLSFDRVQTLPELLRHWLGPLSVALYATDAEAQQFMEFVQQTPALAARTNVGYHIVYKQGTLYPVNVLRNIALSQALTAYVFISDIDFVPMYGLYESLRQAVATQGSMDRKALIVPAFESYQYHFEYPRSKTELLRLVDAQQVHVFRSDVWSKGQKATNYDTWRQASTLYTVPWSEDFEPYVVLERSSAPLFDERFSGFGWNKVTHAMELDARGYDFRCVNYFKNEFRKDLIKKYHRSRDVPVEAAGG